MKFELIEHNPKSNTFVSARTHIKNREQEAIGEKINHSYHFHEELECLFVTCGELVIKMENDNTLTLHDGDVIVFGENVSHDISYINREDTDFYVLHFSAKQILKCMLGDDYSDHLYQISDYITINESDGEYAEALTSCIKKITAVRNSGEQGVYELLFGLLCELVGYLRLLGFISRPLEIDTKTTQSVMEAISYISNNFKEKITPKDVAAQVYFSIDYLGKVFKRATGKTLMEYIAFVRIEEAKNLLLTTSMSISEISAEVGFASSSYFIRSFKKYCYVTPHTYKKTKLFGKKGKGAPTKPDDNLK